MIGEHSRDLLGELGYDASAIDTLIARWRDPPAGDLSSRCAGQRG
ncbi:MAG: hypothetical protein ACJZ2F_01245 [Acidimicrobiales bacterium]